MLTTNASYNSIEIFRNMKTIYLALATNVKDTWILLHIEMQNWTALYKNTTMTDIADSWIITLCADRIIIVYKETKTWLPP